MHTDTITLSRGQLSTTQIDMLFHHLVDAQASKEAEVLRTWALEDHGFDPADQSEDFTSTLRRTHTSIAQLHGLAHSGDLPELLAGASLPADVFGQLLMEHLPIEGMGFNNKSYWARVAEHMGPEYGAFMKYFDGFQ